MTDASIQALSHLRQGGHFQWYVVALIVFAAYFYLNEFEKRNYSAVYLGIAMWAFELIWEMFNGLLLHFNGYAPMWNTPGGSAYLIYVGLPIEISIFFGVGALVLIKALPGDRNMKLAGIPNRIFIPGMAAVAAVIAEVFLNKLGVLVWDLWWWGSPHLYVIFIVYFGPAYALVLLHDRLSNKQKLRLAAVLLVLAALCHATFAELLGWV